MECFDVLILTYCESCSIPGMRRELVLCCFLPQLSVPGLKRPQAKSRRKGFHFWRSGIMSKAPKAFEWPQVADPQPTSRVVSSPKDWREESLLVPHEALRWWGREVSKVLDEFDPVSRSTCVWKTKIFFDFLESYYIPCVHHHHDSEEKIYNVHIVRKCEAQGIPNPFDFIKKEHQELLSKLEKIMGYRTAFEKQDSQASKALVEFKQEFKDLLRFMDDHLAEEERSYPKILLDCGFTEEDEKQAVGEILQSLGLDGNKRLLPAILYAMCIWKGKEKMQQWYAESVPPPIKMLCDNCWIDDFYQNQIRVLEALQQEEEFQLQAPSCNICSLM